MGYEREMSARQKALDLQKKRDAVEAEMNAISAALTVSAHQDSVQLTPVLSVCILFNRVLTFPLIVSSRPSFIPRRLTVDQD